MKKLLIVSLIVASGSLMPATRFARALTAIRVPMVVMAVAAVVAPKPPVLKTAYPADDEQPSRIDTLVLRIQDYQKNKTPKNAEAIVTELGWLKGLFTYADLSIADQVRNKQLSDAENIQLCGLVAVLESLVEEVGTEKVRTGVVAAAQDALRHLRAFWDGKPYAHRYRHFSALRDTLNEARYAAHNLCQEHRLPKPKAEEKKLS